MCFQISVCICICISVCICIFRDALVNFCTAPELTKRKRRSWKRQDILPMIFYTSFVFILADLLLRINNNNNNNNNFLICRPWRQKMSFRWRFSFTRRMVSKQASKKLISWKQTRKVKWQVKDKNHFFNIQILVCQICKRISAGPQKHKLFD